MADQDNEGGGFINVNTLLALVVVLAGVFLVSNRLSSQRPTASPGRTLQSIGEQCVDARLWEDPFGAFEKDSQQVGDLCENFSHLSSGIDQQVQLDPASVHLIPVLIPGGPYAEDRESRVRSRFAVVSALGVAGYAPKDAEHLGVSSLPWPTTTEFETEINALPEDTVVSSTNGPAALRSTMVRVGTLAVTTNVAMAPSAIAASSRRQLRLAFEWFRRRTFAPASTNASANVLVLWIDDDLIQDHPLERLALLTRELIGDRQVRLSILGPRRSSTLRAMVAGAYDGSSRLWCQGSSLNSAVERVLSGMTFYSTTASVMDEVLVRGVSNQPPRAVVRAHLKKTGVKDFYNFACTDAQLASNALAELSLRGIVLTNTRQHLVLVGEWDTFYGRMLSLTYAAELATLQSGSNREDFVRDFQAGVRSNPPNLHVFNYLRGLDGQSVDDSRAEKAGSETSGRRAVNDVSELASWTPDENLAESSAQLDYLSRLGDRIARLERELDNDHGRNSIRAIGVVGSDIYDTLLILQALRKRFPSAVFFTTDLDARIWHPREFEWTRGLVVVSSYGLSVAEAYQQGTPPFRDSSQTAEYLGMLAALDVVSRDSLTNLSPRRFEVGRGGAVDLTLSRSGVIQPPLRTELKPLAPWWLPGTVLALCLILIFLLNRPLRNLLLARSLTKICWLHDEDLGDVRVFLGRLRGSTDSLARWLIEEMKRWERTQGRVILAAAEAPASGAKVPVRSTEAARARRAEGAGTETVRCALLDFLNERIDATWWAPADVLIQSRLLPDESKVRFSGWRHWLRAPVHLAKNRREINMLFDRLELGFGPGSRPELDRWSDAEGQADPLAQWFRRTAESNGAAFPEAARQAFNERLAQYPWAPRPALLSSELVSGSTQANYKWYVHLLRRLRILTKPDALSNRAEMDEFLDRLFGRRKDETRPAADVVSCDSRSAASARKGSARIFWITAYRMGAIVAGLTVFGFCAFRMVRQAWMETYTSTGGEPFSLMSGISAWPTEFLRLGATALAVCFLVDSYCSIRIGVYHVARRFRLAIADDSPSWFLFYARWPFRKARTDASWLWTKYQQMGGFWKRLRRAGFLALLYLGLGWALMLMEGFPAPPIRGEYLLTWDGPLLMGSVLMFLILAFWTIDASLLCRWFIEHLSQAPTTYPESTIRRCRAQNGQVDEDLLDEWIDTELIAELTERVGRLVYYPAIVVLLLFISRNRWWDAWPWPVALIVIFALNLIIAAASVFILQKAAVRARHRSIESLDTKLKLRRPEIESAPEATYHLGERLLDDMKNLRRGAFAPFWENPAIGALLVPSGGIALIEVLLRFWAQ